MKILIKKQLGNFKPNIKVLDIISTDINTSEEIYEIFDNEIPLINFTDTSEKFIIDNLYGRYSQVITETLITIINTDLISLSSGGGDNVGLQEVLDTNSIWQQDNSYYDFNPDYTDIFIHRQISPTETIDSNFYMQDIAYIETSFQDEIKEIFNSIVLHREIYSLINYSRDVTDGSNYFYYNKLQIDENGFSFKTVNDGFDARIKADDLTENRNFQFPNNNGVIRVGPGYKVYKALLTQTGTDAPVATILENTLGNVVWTRDNVGSYKATLTGGFTINKTGISIGSNFNFNVLDNSLMQTNSLTVNDFNLTTYNYLSQAFDEILLNTLVTIEVYD
jgi:hypothetical protein